jgi:hypothetical protein
MKILAILLYTTAVLLPGAALGDNPSSPAPRAVTGTALISVAKHLSAPYALYLYESLSRQVLSNERVMERLDSPQSPMAKDSLWALDVISQAILVAGQDGEYLDVRRVPPFFMDITERYLSPSHYWPNLEITQDTRREHLGAWYSIYLMLLVANASQDEISKTLHNGAFERGPDGLVRGGPSLVDRLHGEGILTDEQYGLVLIKRSGPAGMETLSLPPYVDQWKARISAAYGVP